MALSTPMIVAEGVQERPMPTATDTYKGEVDLITVDTNPGVGKLVYKKSNGNYASAQANSETTMLAEYLMLETGTGSGKKALRCGLYYDGASASLNGGLADTLFVDRTVAGDYVVEGSKPSTTGDIIQGIGKRVSANIIDFNPSSDWGKLS